MSSNSTSLAFSPLIRIQTGRNVGERAEMIDRVASIVGPDTLIDKAPGQIPIIGLTNYCDESEYDAKKGTSWYQPRNCNPMEPRETRDVTHHPLKADIEMMTRFWLFVMLSPFMYGIGKLRSATSTRMFRDGK